MRPYQKNIDKVPPEGEVFQSIDRYEERKWAMQARNAMQQLLLGT